VQRPDELDKYPTLDLGPARAQHQWQLTGPAGEKVEWEHRPRLVTDDMLMLRTAAIAGVGIVQLPSMMMRDNMLRGELVPLLPGWQPQGGVVHAVYPSRRGLLPAVRLLLDYLSRQFAILEEE
jgi:DNA-binding transcriptional LysR family regulator